MRHLIINKAAIWLEVKRADGLDYRSVWRIV